MNEDQILAGFKAGTLSADDVLAFYEELQRHAAERPLSEGQKGLWLLHRLRPDADVYNVPVCFRTDAPLDVDRLRRAFALVVAAHGQLSSAVTEQDGVPYLVARPDRPVHFRHERVPGLSEDALLAEVRRAAKTPSTWRRTRWRGRTSTRRTPPGRSSCWSSTTSSSTAPPPRCSCGTWPRRTRRWGAAPTGARPRRTRTTSSSDGSRPSSTGPRARGTALSGSGPWRATCPCSASASSVPRPPARRCSAGPPRSRSPARPHDRVRSWCAASGVRPAVLFLAVYELLLHRYSGERDLIVGVPSMGRPDLAYADSVGYFVNMVPVRFGPREDVPFRDYARELSLVLADGLDHAGYPFPRMVQDLNLQSDPDSSPVFQVSYVFQNQRMMHVTDEVLGLELARSMRFVEGISQEGSSSSTWRSSRTPTTTRCT